MIKYQFFTELQSRIAQKSGLILQKKMIKLIYQNIVDVLLDDLFSTGRTVFHGVGILQIKRCKARQGHDPSANKPMVIPACNRVRFHPSKPLRQHVSQLRIYRKKISATETV